jgi:hypothetical protein
VTYYLQRRGELKLCKTFRSALGRTRTCDLLIRSWFARVLVRPSLSKDLTYLGRLRRFMAAAFPFPFGSVLTRLQYGCSTLLLCGGRVVSRHEARCPSYKGSEPRGEGAVQLLIRNLPLDGTVPVLGAWVVRSSL